MLCFSYHGFPLYNFSAVDTEMTIDKYISFVRLSVMFVAWYESVCCNLLFAEKNNFIVLISLFFFIGYVAM